MKPDLTYGVKDNAMRKAQGLIKIYPKGLSTRDLAKEMSCTPTEARKTMTAHGFEKWDNRWQVGDVAAMMAYRQWLRKGNIKERI